MAAGVPRLARLVGLVEGRGIVAAIRRAVLAAMQHAGARVAIAARGVTDGSSGSTLSH